MGTKGKNMFLIITVLNIKIHVDKNWLVPYHKV